MPIRPRNAEESELTMECGDDLCWTVVGDDERSQLSSPRQRILAPRRLSRSRSGPSSWPTP